MTEDVEQSVMTLVIDESLPAAIEGLKADGWELIPGIVPVAIYHVVRHKNRPKDMELKMAIDDSKVGILRNGKIVG
jgi:hypothetical protein